MNDFSDIKVENLDDVSKALNENAKAIYIVDVVQSLMSGRIDLLANTQNEMYTALQRVMPKIGRETGFATGLAVAALAVGALSAYQVYVLRKELKKEKREKYYAPGHDYTIHYRNGERRED